MVWHVYPSTFHSEGHNRPLCWCSVLFRAVREDGAWAGLPNKRDVETLAKVQKKFVKVIFKIESESSNCVALSRKCSCIHWYKQHREIFTVREINIIGLSRGRGENVCEAQVLHLGGSLQFPGKGLKIPALTKSGSLRAGPRHQYFLKLPRWFCCAAKAERRAVRL